MDLRLLAPRMLFSSPSTATRSRMRKQVPIAPVSNRNGILIPESGKFLDKGPINS